MTKCAAKGCRNSSNKLVVTCAFPKVQDVARRNKWIQNCQTLGGMQNWQPSATSRLCEFHFPPYMWQTINEKRKLKPDAVPILFGDLVHQVNVAVKYVYEDVSNIVVSGINKQNKSNLQLSGVIITPELTPSNTTNVPKGLISIISQRVEPDEVSFQTPDAASDDDENNENFEVYEEFDPMQENTDIVNDLPREPTNKNLGEAHKDNNVKEEDKEEINEFSDEENTELHNEERRLFDLQRVSSHMEIQSESIPKDKFDKLLKMYEKSERLRIMMKKNHKKKQKNLQSRIDNLQNQIIMLKDNQHKLLKRFNPNEDKVSNQTSKRNS